jgi:dCTP deaminase
LIYFAIEGAVLTPYNQKSNAKYNSQPALPVESMMWKNVF